MEAARDDVRLFAIFLDDYHVRLREQHARREHIARFVEGLNAKDLAGICTPVVDQRRAAGADRKSLAGRHPRVHGP